MRRRRRPAPAGAGLGPTRPRTREPNRQQRRALAIIESQRRQEQEQVGIRDAAAELDHHCSPPSLVPLSSEMVLPPPLAEIQPPLQAPSNVPLVPPAPPVAASEPKSWLERSCKSLQQIDHESEWTNVVRASGSEQVMPHVMSPGSQFLLVRDMVYSGVRSPTARLLTRLGLGEICIRRWTYLRDERLPLAISSRTERVEAIDLYPDCRPTLLRTQPLSERHGSFSRVLVESSNSNFIRWCASVMCHSIDALLLSLLLLLFWLVTRPSMTCWPWLSAHLIPLIDRFQLLSVLGALALVWCAGIALLLSSRMFLRYRALHQSMEAIVLRTALVNAVHFATSDAFATVDDRMKRCPTLPWCSEFPDAPTHTALLASDWIRVRNYGMLKVNPDVGGL